MVSESNIENCTLKAINIVAVSNIEVIHQSTRDRCNTEYKYVYKNILYMDWFVKPLNVIIYVGIPGAHTRLHPLLSECQGLDTQS